MTALKNSPRILVFCCLALFSFQTQAQTSRAKSYPPNQGTTNTKAPSKSRESPRNEDPQTGTALAIISLLIQESEHYRDQPLRVRTQARAADALWNIDPLQARELFMRAWKNAEKVDQEGEERAEEAHKQALGNRTGMLTMIPPAASMRSEVLKLVARRDPAFGETLLAKLDDEKETEGGSVQKTASSRVSDPTEPNPSIAKRLEIALQLLNGGDVKQARIFAEPALNYATSQGIIFLCSLRQKDPQTADNLYANMLTGAASDPNADATTVSLLSSYAFTPTVLVTSTRRGRISNQFGEGSGSGYELSATLRGNFLRLAASILVRPLAPSAQDNSLAGRAGTYFTIARLLPLFEQYAGNYVSQLRVQLALLSPDAPEAVRSGQDSMLRLGLDPPGKNGDSLAEILHQIDAAESSSEKDTLYVKAIRAGATNADPRIRDFADKITDEDLKGRALSFADLALVRNAISKKDVEGGLRIIRSGYLSPLHRVWALSEIGQLVTTDRPRALQLLDDAATEANRIDAGAEDRVYALTCVSSSFLAVDRFRSWSVASDAIRAANSAPGFTGEDAKLSARLRTKNVISMISVDEPSFDIVNLFESLSRDDLQLAISLANDLKEESPHAAAALAIAGSVLKRQKTLPLASRR